MVFLMKKLIASACENSTSSLTINAFLPITSLDSQSESIINNPIYYPSSCNLFTLKLSDFLKTSKTFLSSSLNLVGIDTNM